MLPSREADLCALGPRDHMTHDVVDARSTWLPLGQGINLKLMRLVNTGRSPSYLQEL